MLRDGHYYSLFSGMQYWSTDEYIENEAIIWNDHFEYYKLMAKINNLGKLSDDGKFRYLDPKQFTEYNVFETKVKKFNTLVDSSINVEFPNGELQIQKTQMLTEENWCKLCGVNYDGPKKLVKASFKNSQCKNEAEKAFSRQGFEIAEVDYDETDLHLDSDNMLTSLSDLIMNQKTTKFRYNRLSVATGS